MSNKVYWTTAKGVKIDVDVMDINHLRNTLKMIIRHNENVAEYNRQVALHNSKSFELNGDIANMFNEEMERAEYDYLDDFDYYENL